MFDQGGAPCAGVSLTVNAGRMASDAFIATAAPRVMHLARELSEGIRLSLGAIGIRGGAR